MNQINKNKGNDMIKSTYKPTTDDLRKADTLFVNYPDARELFLAGKKEEAYTLLIEYTEAKRVAKWNADTFDQRLNRFAKENKPFRLIDLVHSGDKIVVKNTPNTITSSISLIYSNEEMSDKKQYTSLNNHINSWKLLKQINELPTVDVMYQVWDEDGEVCTEIPFEESAAYAYRF
tara:strand:+ start:997 stop:1524 length:528 start_codon:yes stop_codon:yes gene_type:complete